MPVLARFDCGVGCASDRTADTRCASQPEGSLIGGCSSVLLPQVHFTAPPQRPFDEPLMNRNLPTTAEDADHRESFHADPPRTQGTTDMQRLQSDSPFGLGTRPVAMKTLFPFGRGILKLRDAVDRQGLSDGEVVLAR